MVPNNSLYGLFIFMIFFVILSVRRFTTFENLSNIIFYYEKDLSLSGKRAQRKYDDLFEVIYYFFLTF